MAGADFIYMLFLELLSLFVIEKMLFKNSVSDYTIFEKSIHSILTAGL